MRIAVIFMCLILGAHFCSAQTSTLTKKEKREAAKAKEREAKERARQKEEDARAKAELKRKAEADKKRRTVKKKKLPNNPSREMSYGVTAATDGYGIGVHRMVRNSDDYTAPAQGFFLELAEFKDARERSRPSDAQVPVNGVAPTNYIYGKIYNNYQLKLGYIRRTNLSGKLDIQNIRISHFWAAGLNMGIFKPYFLNIDRNGATVPERYTENNASIFLNRQFIVGSAGVGRGFNLLSYQFGALGRTGFQFEYLPTRYRGLIGEMGTEFKVGFGNSLTTMANTKAKLVYPSLYITLRYMVLND